MPKATLQPCSNPGCRELVQAGRCLAHQSQRYREQDSRRESSARRGYDAIWRKLRLIKLNASPLCEEHLKRNVVVEAAEVDHIIPIRNGGARLDLTNLQSLCKPCHSQKTIKESVRAKK
jgi:5-methylcytosine-specific restriction protein A